MAADLEGVYGNSGSVGATVKRDEPLKPARKFLFWGDVVHPPCLNGQNILPENYVRPAHRAHYEPR